MMKTLTEYMESTFGGEYHPFTETSKTTFVQLKTGTKSDCKSGSHAVKSARRIAKQMRLDGWTVALGGDLLKVTTP